MPLTNTKRVKTSNVEVAEAPWGRQTPCWKKSRLTVMKFVEALWPFFVCCKNKEASKISLHWQKPRQKRGSGAAEPAQIDTRLMRQVYFCINIYLRTPIGAAAL